MTNAELIAMVRSIAKHGADWRINEVLNRAAAALEAADKRIAELMPKEGEWEAKKPKTVKETEYSFYCDCPTCRGRLISNVDGEWCSGSFDRFCRMCGQKIDWSEYCGWSNKPFVCVNMRGEHDEKQD